MLTNTSFKNHTQTEELKLTPQEAFERRIGRVGKKSQSPLGIETSLGHVYSVFLEEASRSGLDVTVDTEEFINHIKKNLIENGGYDRARKVSLNSPTFHPVESYAVMSYMIQANANLEICSKVMEEVFGPNLPDSILRVDVKSVCGQQPVKE